MEMMLFLVYLADVIDSLNSILLFITLSMFVAGVGVGIPSIGMMCAENITSGETAFVNFVKKHYVKYLTIFTLVVIINVILPTKNVIYIAAGVYGGTVLSKTALDNIKSNDILSKSYDILNLKLDEYLNGLKKENNISK